MQTNHRPPMNDGKPGGDKAVAVAFVFCLVAACLTGTGLLAWWALAFHSSNRQLWMVPVGLVLACTPAVVCLVVTASEPRCPGGKGGSVDAAVSASPAPLTAVVVEKAELG